MRGEKDRYVLKGLRKSAGVQIRWLRVHLRNGGGEKREEMRCHEDLATWLLSAPE